MGRNLLWALMLPMLLISSFQLSAQRNCGVMDHMHAEEQADPHVTQVRQQIEAQTQAYINNTDENSRVDGIITIPVVVHVIYGNSTENISDAQVQSQIDVLNADFRRLNTDADGTWSQAADTEIEFCLATLDPNGAATNGITRTSTSVSAFGTTNNEMKFNSSGGKDAWPASAYLNMWTCDISGGILGYAQFPGGNPVTDGIVMDYQYFGTIGTATAPFNLGRTATHEVGHWLNLRHIWGDGNCNADDFVSDTPTSDAQNFGCATTHTSCNSLDMVQNYMDYSDDACMNLFTDGQKTRMRALFDAGGAKVSLLSSGACGVPAAPTCSDGIQNQGETGVDCGGPCATACATCSDGTQNGDETGVDCGGATCAACPCTGININISITFDNYPEETSWSLVDANGTTVAQGGTYDSQPDGSTISGDFCLTNGCYDFTINDVYGDGICCSYGNGSYSVTDAAGATLVSGATFTSTEVTNFCVDAGGPSCSDGIMNGTETGVDCGGTCKACPTCSDGILNQGETAVDCGGPCEACPTCDTPTGLASAPSDITASLSWTTVTIAGNYNARARQVGAATWITGNGLSSPVNFTGLTACTDYEFQVQSNCSIQASTETSAWSGSFSFTTTGCSSSSCNDGVMNGDETGIDCGGECPACATCSDGVMNGDETGIDCGGSCDPCPTACSNVTLNSNTFEVNWGWWNDGGSDCYRNAAPAYSNGNWSIRLRDNTNSSVMTTDVKDWSAYDDITVDFSYMARHMEVNEDFWLQASTDGGSSFTTIQAWASGTDFENNVRMNESVTITGTFTSTSVLRFRCDASGNPDFVYIDDVVISGCLNSSRDIRPVDVLVYKGESNDEATANLSIGNLSPNPASDVLNVNFAVDFDTDVQFTITDLSGRVLYNETRSAMTGKQTQAIDVNQLGGGYYFVTLQTGSERVVKKFVTIK